MANFAKPMAMVGYVLTDKVVNRIREGSNLRDELSAIIQWQNVKLNARTQQQPTNHQFHIPPSSSSSQEVSAPTQAQQVAE
ncbi:hypothetical protein IL306_007523 [Fusarium sp. DS 682]|nr:hypothetical protein IL306_007523 [Fusarium sp. DS 682]